MQGSATGPSTPKYQQFRAIRGIQLSTTTTEEGGVQGTSSSLAELEVEEVEGVTSEGRLQVGAAAEAAAVAAAEAAAVAAAEAAAVAAAEAAVGEGESPDRET